MADRFNPRIATRRPNKWVGRLGLVAIASLIAANEVAAAARVLGPVAKVTESPGQDTRPATNPLSPLELFKAFVSNPPPIEEVRFSYVGPPIHIGRRTGRLAAAPTEFYWARWQPGYLVNLKETHLRQLGTQPLAEDFGLTQFGAMVRCADDFWEFNAAPRTVTMWTGTPRTPPEFRNPVAFSYEVQAAPLWALISMGPHFASPGSIRWSGNRFGLTTHVSRDSIRIRGEVTAGSDGRASKMLLRYTSDSGDGRYEVRYSYATNSFVPSYLPSRIHSVVFHGSAEYPDKDIRIYSLKTAQRPLTATLFQPARWLTATNLSRFVFTNHELYEVTGSDRLRLVPREQQPATAPLLVLAHANRYYYSASALLTIGLVVLYNRMRRSTSGTHNTKLNLCSKN